MIFFFIDRSKNVLRFECAHLESPENDLEAPREKCKKTLRFRRDHLLYEIFKIELIIYRRRLVRRPELEFDKVSNERLWCSVFRVKNTNQTT